MPKTKKKLFLSFLSRICNVKHIFESFVLMKYFCTTTHMANGYRPPVVGSMSTAPGGILKAAPVLGGSVFGTFVKYSLLPTFTGIVLAAGFIFLVFGATTDYPYEFRLGHR